MKFLKDKFVWIVIVALVAGVFAGAMTMKTVKETTQTKKSIADSEKKLDTLNSKLEELAKDSEAEAGETVEDNTKEEAEPAPTEVTPSPTPEAEAAASTENSNEGSGVFQAETATGNGHVVAIDPGHQGSWVDMSATEPNGPGSSTMKARCSTGTSGTYSGLAEYQLNLDVSLKLQTALQERGYEVVMTRTDNDANISNSERALLAADSGAEIYVRVHANGDDSGSVSGALSMSPSPDNPYVANLYEESNRLSQDVVNSYCAATGFANLGVQYYDNMTGINWSKIPVTIIEMGFMTSQHDDTAMAQDDFQYTMAQGIADGIDAYFAGQ